jgi:hypothetical protein
MQHSLMQLLLTPLLFVTMQFQRAQLSLDNDQFLQLLKKLDDCIAYVASNPQV